MLLTIVCLLAFSAANAEVFVFDVNEEFVNYRGPVLKPPLTLVLTASETGFFDVKSCFKNFYREDLAFKIYDVSRGHVGVDVLGGETFCYNVTVWFEGPTLLYSMNVTFMEDVRVSQPYQKVFSLTVELDSEVVGSVVNNVSLTVVFVTATLPGFVYPEVTTRPFMGLQLLDNVPTGCYTFILVFQKDDGTADGEVQFASYQDTNIRIWIPSLVVSVRNNQNDWLGIGTPVFRYFKKYAGWVISKGEEPLCYQGEHVYPNNAKFAVDSYTPVILYTVVHPS